MLRIEKGVPTLDLHWMDVKTAVQITKTFLLQSHGNSRRIRIVTGRGLHSFDGVAKIKNAVEELLLNRGITYKMTAKGGCFLVPLDGSLD